MDSTKSSPSKRAPFAWVVLAAACGGGSQSQPANVPTSGQYGSAMSQPAPGGPETTPGSMTQQYSGTSPPSSPGESAGGDAGMNDMHGMGGTPNQGGSQYGATIGAPQSTTTGPAGATGMMDVSTLNDAQLAAVVQAINSGEIQQAQLAQSKASAAEVKRFARDMLTAHREMQNHDNALLARMQLTPVDNAVSNQLKADTQSEMTTLQGLRGKDFDRDYIDGQVRGHNKAIEIFDRVIPSVKSSELKADLQNARPKIEAHLRQAEQVQQSLQTPAASVH